MENTKQPDITTDEAPAILRIARHEHVLTARIDDAKSQAEALLARARENAALIERQAAEALEAELEAIRREAAVKRSQLREAVLAIAETHARNEVDRARPLVGGVAAEMAALALPGPAGENRS